MGLYVHYSNHPASSPTPNAGVQTISTEQSIRDSAVEIKKLAGARWKSVLCLLTCILSLTSTCRALGVASADSLSGSLTGCSNPNSSSPQVVGWGTQATPIYSSLEFDAGTPSYSANSIFWTSHETLPGQSVLVTGAFSKHAKKVQLAAIPEGTINWQTIVAMSKIVVPTKQMGSTALAFTIPSSFPVAKYGFAILDSSATQVMGLANTPEVNWVIGVPATQDPHFALQQEVHDCAAEPGESLRIFGKNFVAGDSVILVSPSNDVVRVSPTRIDSNSLTVQVPGSIALGQYHMWVGNIPWSVTSSAVYNISIVAPPAYNIVNASCDVLVGDGNTDDTSALQECLDRNAPVAGSNDLVYLSLPVGDFVLTSIVRPHPFQILVGQSTDETRFIGRPGRSSASGGFAIPQHFGMANLSFLATSGGLMIQSQDMLGQPSTAGHLFFSKIDIEYPVSVASRSDAMFIVTGPDIQVYGSKFLSGSNLAFGIAWGDGAVVSNNEFVLNNWTCLGFQNSQNMVFDGNLIHSQSPLGQGPGGHSGGAGFSISRYFSKFSPSALSQDIYIGYNTFRDVGSQDQQIITTDGGGGAYLGPISSSTATSVTLSNDPSWVSAGITNPATSAMAIISGTGVGQYSKLASINGRTILLQTPWKVLPDATSIVVISQYQLNLTAAHNIFLNTLGRSILFAGTFEGLIEDNELTNSGSGIEIAGIGVYNFYQSVINNDVLRNSIDAGASDYLSYSFASNTAGIGIFDEGVTLMSGVVLRDNSIPTVQTIYSTNGYSGVSGVLIEQNQGNWYGPGISTDGFLIQGNTGSFKSNGKMSKN
jgi:hypothetical protein